MKEEKSIAKLLQFGKMGLELGRWQQAEDYFDLVLERAPGHPRALLGKAKACQDPREALDLVGKVLSVRPASREARQLQKELAQKVEASREPPLNIIHLPSGTGEEKGASASLEEEILAHDRPSLGVAARRNSPPPHLTRKAPEENPERPLARRLGHAARRLFTARMDTRTRRKLIAGYVVVNLIVGGLIMAALYPRLLPLFDEQVTMEAVHPLSDDNGKAAEVVFPSANRAPNPLRQAERATALIIVPDPIFQDVSRGSGSVISFDGLVITNHHVMTREADGTLANREGLALVGLTEDVRESPSVWYIACLVASDPRRDLAVLRMLYNGEGRPVRGLSFPHMPLGNSDTLDLGQPLVGLGYPSLGGDTLTLTQGSMAGFFSSRGDLHLGKTDSELLPGSSGGAVLDHTGRLVGVITAAHTDQRTQGRLSYFVLLNEAKEVIRKGQLAPRPNPQIEWLVEAFDELVE